MTHPAVDFVLSAIKDNWSAGSYADIPLERIDRDNSNLLDENIRKHSDELQANNFVGATFADRIVSPIGTEFDHDIDAVVGVRVEGLHHTEYGNVNPSASLPPAIAGDPVPWTDLVKEIRDAILTDRVNPDTGETDIGYTHLTIENEVPDAAAYGDYYRTDFDVIFNGFETLP